MRRGIFFALFAVALVYGALSFVIRPQAQVWNLAHLGVAVRAAETVFDNSGNPWPFFNQIDGVFYDQGGNGVAYSATASPFCAVVGTSTRPDYINFKVGSGGTPFRIGCWFTNQLYKYTINISQAGPYVVNANLSNGGTSSGSVGVFLDGNQVAAITSPVTGSYDTFATQTSGIFNAALGNHIITMTCLAGNSPDNACGDLNWIQGGNSTGIPVLAQNAGFTTAIINDDFSQPTYATQSNWLQCANTDAGSQIWRTLGPAGYSRSPCNVNQGFDTVAGTNVMVFDWPPGTQGCCANPNNDKSGIVNQIALTTARSDNLNSSGIFAANFFIDNVCRVSPPFTVTATPPTVDYWTMTGECLWTYGGGSVGDPNREQSGGFETDSMEQTLGAGSVHGITGWAVGGATQHDFDPQDGTFWNTGGGTPSANLPSGYRAQDYHRYSVLVTSNGTEKWVCMFVDLILQTPCKNVTVTAPLARVSFQYSWGPFYQTSPTQGNNEARQYVRYGRVWSCANWQVVGLGGQCNNTTKHGPDANGLVYYGP